MEWRQVTEKDVGKGLFILKGTSYNPCKILWLGKNSMVYMDRDGVEIMCERDREVRPYVEPINIKVGDLVLAIRTKTKDVYTGLILGINESDNSVGLSTTCESGYVELSTNEWTFKKILTE